MNAFLHNLKNRYLNIIHLLIAAEIIVTVMFLGYRIRVLNYIHSIFPDIGLGGALEYLSLSIHYDSLAMLYILAAFMAAMYVFAGTWKIKFLINSILTVLFIFFILFSIEFFRVYETTFQTNFAGKEHFSDPGNVVNSAMAEFSSGFYVSFFIAAGLVVILNLCLFRWEKYNEFSEMVEERPGSITGGVLLYHLPAILAALLIAGIISDPAARIRKIASRHGKDEALKNESLLREFSLNPVYNIISGSHQNDPRPVSRALRENGFSYRLNTDSIESSQRYHRVEDIPRSKRYNIILYFFESTPYEYLDIKINDRYVVETWRRLEKNSLNFRNHYANYPLSANALLTVFASAYDLNSKDMVIEKYPDIRLNTLPQILKSHGYRTCLIHTGGLGYAGQKRFLKTRKLDHIVEYDQLIKRPPYNHQVGWGVDERAMIEPGIEFIDMDRARPYFLVFLPVNPHHPYAIPDDRFRITGDPDDGPDYRARNWHNYLNSLHYSDVSLGMLVDALERRGLMEDTLLFLFADHGEAFYQHKMNYNHPLFIYQENVHVPFLIYNKELFPGPRYFDGTTRHIDITPTILDILGIQQIPEQEGVPALSPHREQLALLHTSWKDDYMGVADRRWKYIVRTGDRYEELYDIREDPGEKKNLALRHPDIAERYRRFVQDARAYKDEYYNRVLKK